MRIKSEVYVNISETVLVVCHEVCGVFDGFSDQVTRVEGVYDGLLEVLVVRFLSQVGQIHTVEKCLVPKVGFVAHLLRKKFDCKPEFSRDR